MSNLSDEVFAMTILTLDAMLIHYNIEDPPAVNHRLAFNAAVAKDLYEKWFILMKHVQFNITETLCAMCLGQYDVKFLTSPL